jgi:hypothetical protein
MYIGWTSKFNRDKHILQSNWFFENPVIYLITTPVENRPKFTSHRIYEFIRSRIDSGHMIAGEKVRRF